MSLTLPSLSSSAAAPAAVPSSTADERLGDDLRHCHTFIAARSVPLYFHSTQSLSLSLSLLQRSSTKYVEVCKYKVTHLLVDLGWIGSY